MKNSFKHRFSLMIATLLLVLATGCQSLQETPNFADPDTFFKSRSDISNALNGAYRPMSQQWFNTYYNRSVFDCALGITTGYEKGPQYYKQGAYVASDEYIVAYWNDNYAGINRANAIIENLPNVPVSAITEEFRKQSNGEARFLRALYLYQLYIYFENIPVPTESTKNLTVRMGNEGGKKKALVTMVEDLKIAEADLASSYGATDGGRPTKWAAKALLAKVYLEDAQWQLAADKAFEVIDKSGLSLFSNFNDNFDPAKENTGERLFEIQNNFFVSPDNINNMHAHYTPTDWDGGDPNTLIPGDGKTAAGWGDAWIVGDVKMRAMFDANDKRISTTFMEQYRSKNVKDVVRFSPTANSPFVSSGSSERTFKNVILQKMIEYNTGNWNQTKKNYIILRLADTYLAHSEAVANGATGNGTFGINAVRTRAALPPVTAAGSNLKNIVFDEYVREFIGEGWVFPTARRFGKTAELIRTYTGRTVDNAKFRVLPIPLVEINANAAVKQNTGW